MRYSLPLRYTSIQLYKVLLQDFKNALHIEGKISEDVGMIFDEMYLQKSQEFFWGEMIGCDDEGELYQGIVCFMIVGMKESIPSPPETNIDANWVKAELLESLEILSNCDFHNRAIVCDNHPQNVSSFKKLLEHVIENPDELYMLYKSRKICFCYDAIHLIRNVPNNLLKCK